MTSPASTSTQNVENRTVAVECLSKNKRRAENNEMPNEPKAAKLINTEGNIKEQIGFALHLRLRDQRWEVKDSALEFVIRLVKSRTAFGTSIVQHHILSCVWDALDDVNESYVRSSAWQAMGCIIDNDTLWTSLKKKEHLTEKDVITKILHTLEHDSEAYPRRSCIDCIIEWINNRNPIVAALLCKPHGPESSPESLPLTLFGCIIKFAVEDFDWEVKVRGIQVIEGIIKSFLEEQPTPGSEQLVDKSKSEVVHQFVDANSTTASCQISDGDVKNVIEDVIEKRSSLDLSPLFSGRRAKLVKHMLTILHDMKALGLLLKACDDCDHPVCEKALKVVETLKSYIVSVCYSNNFNTDVENLPDAAKRPIDNSPKLAFQVDNSSENKITSLGQLFHIINPIDNVSVERFVDVICRLDVQSLIDSCSAADSNIRSNPACFLEDILACAKDDTENLLDCY